MSVIGIDVASKVHEVCGVTGCDRCENTAVGIRKFLKLVPKGSVIGLESTGGYGLMLAEMACKAGFTVYMVSGKQVKHYRISLGRRAKTDMLDAVLVRDFVTREIGHLRPYKPWPKDLKALRDMVRLRTRLAQDKARTRQRMRAMHAKPAEIETAGRGLDVLLKNLDKRIKEKLRAFDGAKALASCPGLGPLNTAALTAAIEHFQFEDGDALVAMVGLDMTVDESATVVGAKRITKTGDCTMRHLIYVAATSATRSVAWRDDYQALLAKGLKKPQAICALARKILKVALPLYQNQEVFDLNTRRRHQHKGNANPMA